MLGDYKINEQNGDIANKKQTNLIKNGSAYNILRYELHFSCIKSQKRDKKNNNKIYWFRFLENTCYH